MRLIYSQEAVADLARLRAFIADRNPAASTRIAAELATRIDRLRNFPEMGRGVAQAPDPDTVRDFVFGRYVVRYTMHDSALVVLRIWHHLENRQSSA